MAAPDIRRVVNGELNSGDSVEYEGIFLIHQGSGDYIAQLDGHVGTIDEFNTDDYVDPLELIDDLNHHLIKSFELISHDNDDELIEWAGKIITRNKERAEENPEKYIHYEPQTGV